MRLKTLFFPVILVISIVIFSFNIWPEISNLKKANEIGAAKKQELVEIDAKKVAIASVGAKISNSDDEKIVKEYLPAVKIEERILSGISFLADGANVSLVNVSLSGESTISADSKEAYGGIVGMFNPIARAEAIPVGAPLPGGAMAVANSTVVKSEADATTANISVSGDYEKIRTFLNSIHRMPIFNSIKSLSISKQQAEKTEEGVVADSNVLLANVVVDFGYMPIAKVDGQKAENVKTDMKEETEIAAVLKGYISQKTQSLELDNGSKGKSNPFLAN